MKNYQFTIIASGLDPSSDDFEDRFFESGCDDATLSFQRGVIVLEFDREARNYAVALVSAVRDVRAAGATVDHVEPDYLVSLSDIAKRSGLTRAAVSLFARGERGREFPRPIARVTTESPLWDWVAVARWMHKRNQLGREAVIEAKATKAVSYAVARYAQQKQDAERNDSAAA